MSVRRWNWVVSTCLVTAITLAASPASAQQSQNWKRCENKDDADLAIRACTEIIQSGRETKKNMAIAFRKRGIAYKTLGQYDSAIADFNESIRLDPTASCFHCRGIAYFAKGDFSAAAADFMRANDLELDPYVTLLRYLARSRAGENG